MINENMQVTEGQCPDVAYSQKHVFPSNDKEAINFSMFKDMDDNQSIPFSLNKVATESIYKLIKEKNLPFFTYEYLDITSIQTNKLVKEIFSKIGNIIATSLSSCMIEVPGGYVVFGRGTELFNESGITHCLQLNIYANSFEDMEHIYFSTIEHIKPILTSKEWYMNIDWYYMDIQNGVSKTRISDKISDVFLKEAYPYLDIEKLSEDYFNSNEPIVLLMGPPGTGKTRLIRYIINLYASKKESNVDVIYSSDQRIIQDGKIFLEFVGDTGCNFLVLEDIDYHLSDRKDGNTQMYNFLAISNGLAVNHQQDKKIILSTNLPNINNIDPALLRPGRCFSIINTRELYYDESVALLNKLEIDKKLIPEKSYTLGELYNIQKENYQNEQCASKRRRRTGGFV